jgi:hypothetical protein
MPFFRPAPERTSPRVVETCSGVRKYRTTFEYADTPRSAAVRGTWAPLGVTMNHDPLSDVLTSVRLRGAIFYYVSCARTWVAETPPSAELADALSPGAEHVIAYHMMLRGSGWAGVDGLPPQRFNAGDIVMFPRGDTHTLSSAPGMRAAGGDQSWRATTRNHPKPILVALHDGAAELDVEVPQAQADAVLVCGFISCDLRPFNPLIDALPRMLHLPAGALGAWVAPMFDQAPSRGTAAPAARPCSSGCARWCSSMRPAATSSRCPRTPVPAGSRRCATAMSAGRSR